jgi:hypothetical protein
MNHRGPWPRSALKGFAPEQRAAKLLARDEAQRIAANIAKLPEPTVFSVSPRRSLSEDSEQI